MKATSKQSHTVTDKPSRALRKHGQGKSGKRKPNGSPSEMSSEESIELQRSKLLNRLIVMRKKYWDLYQQSLEKDSPKQTLTPYPPFDTVEEWVGFEPVAPKTKFETILDEAKHVTAGGRNYGTPEDNFSRIAICWEVILNCKVSAAQVGLCMIAMKLCREANSHKRDSLVDIAGYAKCVSDLYPDE